MKPILFNAEMVRAILSGSKTVTRRAIKPQPIECISKRVNGVCKLCDNKGGFYLPDEYVKARSKYLPGEILYVREAWNCLPIPEPLRGTSKTYWYKADECSKGDKWKPSIHMPKEAARIFLRVTNVWVERLQNITFEQALKEGCNDYTSTANGFFYIWDSTIKPADRAIYGWDANPWVWVIEFERISKEEAEKCKTCYHHKYLANMCCACGHYAIDTGRLRDCEPGECTHWQPKDGIKKKERVDIHLPKK